MLRISSPTDSTAQMFMWQTNTLSRKYRMLIDSSSLKEITTAQITLTHQYVCFIFTNKTDQTHKSLLLTITFINKKIHEHKTNIWKPHLDKIDHKHNPHSLWGTIAKLSNKKQPTQQNRSICFEIKTAITDIEKAKAFNKQFTNITLYSTSKIKRHVNHTIKTIRTEEIQLTTTQVQLAISNSTNNNSTGPDCINIRHLKHLRPLAIRYLTNMYNIALNTDTIIPSLETCHNHPHSKTKQRSQHWHKLLTHITFITHCQNTRVTKPNTITMHNRKYSNHFSSTWI